MGHLHAGAQATGGEEGGAGAVPLRQPGARRRALPRRQLQRQVGGHQQRQLLLAIAYRLNDEDGGYLASATSEPE